MADQHKLDPSLLEMVEVQRASPSATDQIDIILSLDSPADEVELEALAALGMVVNSVIGEIITGSVPVKQLEKLITLESVIKVEGSGQLSPETLPTD